MNKPLIEICLDSVDSVINAEKGGADRVELCSDLFEGGLTPSYGTFLVAKRLTNIKINCMVRPRGGDFCYSNSEFEVMKEEVKFFRDNGANAIVFGILNPDGTIDEERSKEIIDLARPLPVTFHRAFDMTRNALESLEILIKLGVDRVLTSGLEPTVTEGLDTLSTLIEKAGDRIVIMPGCGINERNFPKIKDKLKAKEYHIYLPGEIKSKMTYHPEDIYMGGMLRQSEFIFTETNTQRVENIIGLL